MERRVAEIGSRTRVFPILLEGADFEFRLLAAWLSATAAVLMCGPSAIRRLQAWSPERVASDSKTLDALHARKSGTPGMGGLIVLAASGLSVFVFVDVRQPEVLVVSAVGIVLAALGFHDDRTKATTRTKGISARRKLLVQGVTGLAAGAALFPLVRTAVASPWGLPVTTSDWWPSGIAFVAWVTVAVIVGSNAVNLTDGLDGLASGITVLAIGPLLLQATLAAFAARSLPEPMMTADREVAVLFAALGGGITGFLWFNLHPAQVFLGDTGALSTGGMLTVAAVAMRVELLLLISGGVFVGEVLSVVLQVGSFRLTGKRILRCSPLHNHFVFRGDPEPRIVGRFLVVGGLLSLVAAALVCV